MARGALQGAGRNCGRCHHLTKQTERRNGQVVGGLGPKQECLAGIEKRAGWNRGPNSSDASFVDAKSSEKSGGFNSKNDGRPLSRTPIVCCRWHLLRVAYFMLYDVADFSSNAACAAARRAVRSRNGEQET
jgi:hypothetical protein